MDGHSAPRLRAVSALIGSLALAATLLAAAPVSAASPTACRVRNLDTGITKASLQRAVWAAKARHRLTVRGTCRGTTTIAKNLTISGIRRAGSGMPTLDGALSGTVVKVRSARVTFRDLVIQRGAGVEGGGIRNGGTVVLRDVIVRDNSAVNRGGVYNRGTLVMNGSSSISGNVAEFEGGGIFASYSTVTMNGSSSISGNTAQWSGGVFASYSTVTMNGSSSISGNTATIAGGGLVEGPGASWLHPVDGGSIHIHDNVPNDLMIWVLP